MEYKWNFPAVKDGEMKGIGQGDIEMFRGHPYESLAREICQNSLDATLNKDKPVLVEFSPFDISPNDIPDFSTLKKNLNEAANSEPVKKDKRANKFYSQAIKMTDEMFCPMLRISDYNTTGLLGSGEKDDSPWINLVKKSGFSNKTETSGGSYGIGKAAAFACSVFQTVFYSTLDKEGKEASQGVAKLASYRKEDDYVTTGTGYCGQENKPVFRQLSLQKNFKRTENDFGTDVYICGFKISSDWKKEIVISVLDSFLYAIYKKTLIVRIDDIEIKYDTLGKIITEFCTDKNSTIANYYKVLTYPETKEFKTNYKEKGLVRLKLLISQEFQSHRKVAMIRATGMRIMEQGKINAQIPFAGILSIEGEGINEYLRNLENPEHTKWEVSRAEEGHKREAERFIAGLITYIRDCLNELVKNDTSINEIDPGIGDYLPSLEDYDGEKEMQDVISDMQERIELKRKKVITSDINPSKDEHISESDISGMGDKSGIGGKDFENGDAAGAGNNYGTGEGGVGKNSGNQMGAYNGSETHSSIELKTCRIIPVDRSTGKYKLFIVSMKDCDNASLRIFQAAESDFYVANIREISVLGQRQVKYEHEILQNVILKQNEKTEIDFIMDSSDYSSFEVKCYENTK